MIKIAFFDIDGTLVSFRTHRIPESTLQAVYSIRQQGVKVFIATGRPMPFIDNLGDLEYDGIMSVNGACSMLRDGTVIHRQCVSKDDIQRFVDYSESHPIPVLFATNEEVFSANGEAIAESECVREVMQLLNIDTPPVRPLREALERDILQVIAFFTQDEEPTLLGQVLRDCTANRWHPAFADCIVRGINKAVGIDHICRHFGFDISETIAFGDGGNDIEMLQHAGIGVAMGNATDEVKAYADYVTASVDEDGIAKALRQFIIHNS